MEGLLLFETNCVLTDKVASHIIPQTTDNLILLISID